MAAFATFATRCKVDFDFVLEHMTLVTWLSGSMPFWKEQFCLMQLSLLTQLVYFLPLSIVTLCAFGWCDLLHV